MEDEEAAARPRDDAHAHEDTGDARAEDAAAAAEDAAPIASEKAANERPVDGFWFFNSDDDEDEDGCKKPKKTVRDALEVSYVGTTRAVVGHGFQVRELLFGDEFTSLRFIRWEKGSASYLKYVVGRIAARMGLPGPVVEFAEEITYQTKMLHFVNKSVAAKVYERLMRGKKNKALVIEPVRAATLVKPEEITTASLTGRINMTWADGVATGGAHVEFGSVEAANAFLRTCPVDMKAKPLGIDPEDEFLEGDQEEVSDHVLHMREMRQSLMEMDPWRPPLRFEGGRGNFKRPAYFDETAIGELDAQTVLQLKYRVKICSGLAKQEDEVRAREVLFPHRFTKCTVDRISKTTPYEHRLLTKSRSLDFTRVFDDCRLTDEEVFKDWTDKTAVRTGVFISFRDLKRMDDVYEVAMASQHWRVMERPYSQPVRLYVEYIYRLEVKEDVYEFFREKIDEIGRNAQATGVRYIVKGVYGVFGPKEVVFRSRGLAALQRIADLVEKVFVCEKLPSALTGVLLSQAGHKSVEVWAENLHKSNLCVRVDEKNKSIWAYGTKRSRELAIASLRTWAKEIQAKVEVLDHVVRVNVGQIEAAMAIIASAEGTELLKGKKGVMKWMKSQPGVKKLFHSDVLGDGSRIVISGSTAAVKDLIDAWSSTGYLLRRADQAEFINETLAECGVCMLPADEPSITFALCGHVFCHECIRPGVSASSDLPLKCPVENCGALVHVNDVSKILVNLSAITETALFDYVAMHPTECAVCPKSGCNQVLPRATTGDNHLVFCECCSRNYCLECSETMGRAMEGHEDLSCDDFRRLCSSGSTDIHVQFIREKIFTLCCPSCKAAFLDFDGCTSVFCGNVTCRQFFCANCLEYSSKSSDATHKHVLTCPKNPARGNYFVSEMALALVHRAQRTAKLREYLIANISNRDVRRIILSRLAQDLADLKIPMPDDLFPLSNGSKVKAKSITAPAQGPPAA